MKELYIVRHGIAVEHGAPGIPDDERPLTSKGEKRMRQIAQALVKLELKLDRIVTSPLPRARATAEIIALALEAQARLENANILRAGTAAASIQGWLRDRTEDRLMVVGHNPGLSELVALLVMGKTQPQICDLKKGGIAALAPTGPSNDRFEIAWIATPRLLRDLAGDDRDADE
jgi:phosphohistidine phosphatase